MASSWSIQDGVASLPPSHVLVASLTGPSLIWLFVRFAESLWRQHKALKHHLKQALLSNDNNSAKNSNKANLAFAIHVLTGLPLVLTAPYLAYLLIPGVLMNSQGNENETAMWFLKILSLALMVVNATVVFWIVPHPSRYKTYGDDNVTPRSFCRGLAILYVAGLQFTAMPLSCWIFLSGSTDSASAPLAHVIPLICAILTPLIYWWTVLICASELMGLSWEDSVWARPVLQHCMGYGVKQKSKLTAAFINADTPKKRLAQVVMFTIFGSVGILASVEAVGFLVETLARATTHRASIGRAQELYFCVLCLYLTLIMSAGFFTMSQSIFDADLALSREEAAAAAATKDDAISNTNTKTAISNTIITRRQQLLLTRGEVKVLMETLLTQALPVALLVVGPEWVGASSMAEFLPPFLLWQDCTTAS